MVGVRNTTIIGVVKSMIMIRKKQLGGRIQDILVLIMQFTVGKIKQILLELFVSEIRTD